jgi:hypothetical protein
MGRIKQELERLSMGDIGRVGNIDKDIRIRKSKTYVDISRQEKYGSYDQGEEFTNIII